jgi:hypothetical protein
MDVIRFMTMWKTDVKGQDLNSWEEFEEKLKELETVRPKLGRPSEFLYRGQSSSGHSLKTTLERYTENPFPMVEYHGLISRVRPQIETFTGQHWEIFSESDFKRKVDERDRWAFMLQDAQDSFSYMAYLRHYGFPSPLLDWTASPFVAAFFAFRKEPLVGVRNVSIYAYLGSISGARTNSSNRNHIETVGPYVKTDKRHFDQQSRYTFCIVHDGEWRYAGHEEVFSREDLNQDLLWKFNIPSSERKKALKKLEEYNLNSHSLFGSHESLMETLAFREIALKRSQ